MIHNSLVEPSFDYAKLRGKIKEVYGTEGAFAKALGMEPCTLSLKLNGKRFFKSGEIASAIKLLDLDAKDTFDCFFCEVR